MIEALLHGKLSREQENMEDILTANVFGLFQYLAPEAGLFRFLTRTMAIEGERPLESFLDKQVLGADVWYSFWPKWAGCEPDNSSRSIDQPEIRLPSEFCRFYKNPQCPQLATFIAVNIGDPVKANETAIYEALISAGWFEWGISKEPKDWDYWYSRAHIFRKDREDNAALIATALRCFMPERPRSLATLPNPAILAAR